MIVTRVSRLIAGAALLLVARAAAQVPQQADAPRLRQQAGVVRVDLRNLVVAQEAFFADHVRYSASLDSLRFTPSEGVTITLERASDRGWSATAGYAGTPLRCWIYVGSAPKPRPNAREGTPECEGEPGGPTVVADSIRTMMDTMGPMFGNLMGTMYEGMLNALSRPETAEKLAAFTRNYYEALVRHGFTPEQALRIVSTVGIPTLR
jgi:hypothetical protein